MQQTLFQIYQHMIQVGSEMQQNMGKESGKHCLQEYGLGDLS